MIAKYNGCYYRYVFNPKKKISNVVTKQENKAGTDFIYEDGFYFKSVAFEDLEEVFDIKYIVFYDAKIPQVSSEWEVITNDKKDDTILIRFSNGILPGWNTEENNVCTKRISFNDIHGAKEIRIYRRKNGQTLDTLFTEETRLNKEDFIKIWRNNNYDE